MIALTPRFPVNFCSSQGPDHELLSPNDHRSLTKIQYATSEDIEGLLRALPRAQEKMKTLKAYERSRILREVARKIEANSARLSWLISAEGGKPLKDAKAEVARAQVTFELCAEEALRIGGETLPMERTPAGENHLAFTLREPIGVVLAISAFNHPLNLLAHQVGPALASGCAVVIKPAPNTPLSAFELQKFFIEAGLPSECIPVVNAEIPEIEKLVSSDAFGFVSFIGSARVGWELRKKIAPGTRLSLEHGGQAPTLIREDADLEAAIPLLVKGAFYHAGQVCISTQKIFVHETIYDKFLPAFKSAVGRLKTGSAEEEDTDVGPLIRTQEVERIRGWIEEALSKGAKVVLGNEISQKPQYLLPTILTDVPLDTKVMQEEVFGPVVCVNSYKNEEEVLKVLNQNPYIFEAALFTRDIQKALEIARDFSTMTMVINNHSAFRVDWMPFGGHKLSGLGMGGVKYAIEEMTRIKQIIVKL
jgi:acyl-CoA reductase-like NAD-dependent aldehyde dehydrogenase